MKTIISILIAIRISCFVNAQKAQTDTLNFKVEGVCEMCKQRIEEASLIKGVKSAKWDKGTGILTAIIRPDKVTEDDIHKSISNVGYTTSKVKATEAAYKKLPKCCRYNELEKH